jgi:phosphate transport system substrate-binding protein
MSPAREVTMSRTSAFVRAVAGAFAALTLTLAHAAPEAPGVKGTGGSTVARALAQWTFLFSKQAQIPVEYTPANSDVGIRESIARSIDFGCTEIPLGIDDLKKNELIQFPLLIGGVVVIANIPGVDVAAVRLTPDAVAKIFVGEIRSWSDGEIRASNPSLSLPNLPIKVVVRETPASSTLALTSYLDKVDRAWAARFGATRKPAWPMPTLTAPTVQALGQKVASTPGAIGYVAYDEAYRNKLAAVQLRNQAGHWVKPSHESIQAASNMAGMGNGEQVPNLIHVGGASSWPLVEVTYVLLDRKPKDVERARSTLKFFYWAFMQGDRMAAETGFVPLPAATQARVVGRFRDVLGPDASPINFLK